MLAAPSVTLEWITGRMTVIEATHYVPPMTDPERDAWVRSYFEALSGLPGPLVVEAFDHVSRSVTRKPTPADIRNRALSMRSDALQRIAMASPPRSIAPPEPQAPDPRIVEQMRDLADQLAANRRKADLKRQTYDTPLAPRAMSDREIETIIAGNPARAGMSVERFREVEGVPRP